MEKLYNSADIEGVCGIEDWKETELTDAGGAWFRKQMSEEVRAACEGAVQAGVRDILVKDAHDSGRNIDASILPANVRLLRGWTEDPRVMMAGLDETFGGVLFIGYHSGANTDGNPLAHTMSLQIVSATINGIGASEFLINTYTAASLGVPVLFLSGDAMLCDKAEALGCGIRTVAVSRGLGGASISIHPDLARERIRETVAEAVSCAQGRVRVPELPSRFVLRTRYRDHAKAYRASFFPGARASGSHEIEIRARNWNDILVFMLFNY